MDCQIYCQIDSQYFILHYKSEIIQFITNSKFNFNNIQVKKNNSQSKGQVFSISKDSTSFSQVDLILFQRYSAGFGLANQ